MGGVSLGTQHAELANNASNIDITSEPEERASKRLKMDDSSSAAKDSVAIEQTVPGEGLHDAPASKENENPPTGGNDVPAQKENRPPNPEHVDGRVKGMASIKKE